MRFWCMSEGGREALMKLFSWRFLEDFLDFVYVCVRCWG